MPFDITSYKDILGAIAVLLGIVGYGFYIKGIIAGKVKPHFFSWFIWAILTVIVFVAQVVKGGGPGVWVTGFTGIMSFVFAFVGLTSSSRSLIAKSDWIYFIASLLTIPVWYFTGDPLWSVILVSIIDAAAFVPTFRKGYEHPETEDVTNYVLAAVKFLFGLAALQSFTWTTALYPASIVITDFLFVFLLLYRKAELKNDSR